MAEFVLKYADSRGEIRQQVAEGSSEQEVRARFSDQGYLVYSVRSRDSAAPLAGVRLRRRQQGIS